MKNKKFWMIYLSGFGITCIIVIIATFIFIDVNDPSPEVAQMLIIMIGIVLLIVFIIVTTIGIFVLREIKKDESEKKEEIDQFFDNLPTSQNNND